MMYHAAVPVLYDEGEQVGHGRCPKLAQSVVIEARVQADDLKLDILMTIMDIHNLDKLNEKYH